MASLRKPKLAVDTLRCTFASRITINPTPPISRIYLHGSNSSSIPAKLMISGFSPFHSVSQMPIGSGLHMGAMRIHHSHNYHVNNPFLTSAAARRFYCAIHFMQKEPTDWSERFLRLILVYGCLRSSGIWCTILELCYNLEEVPYTKRERLVQTSRDREKGIGEAQFQQIKAAYTDKALPALHRDTVRVHWIAQNVIKDLQTGLQPKVAACLVPPGNDVDEALQALSQGEDSKVADESGLKWEVLVVNKPIVNASCLPGGKIVVFAGLLEHLTTDAEIATILCHNRYLSRGT